MIADLSSRLIKCWLPTAGNRDRARSGDDEEGKRQQDGLAGQFSGVHPSRLAVLAARMGVDKHYGSQHESQAPKRRQHGEDSRSSMPLDASVVWSHQS